MVILLPKCQYVKRHLTRVKFIQLYNINNECANDFYLKLSALLGLSHSSDCPVQKHCPLNTPCYATERCRYQTVATLNHIRCLFNLLGNGHMVPKTHWKVLNQMGKHQRYSSEETKTSQNQPPASKTPVKKPEADYDGTQKNKSALIKLRLLRLSSIFLLQNNNNIAP